MHLRRCLLTFLRYLVVVPSSYLQLPGFLPRNGVSVTQSVECCTRVSTSEKQQNYRNIIESYTSLLNTLLPPVTCLIYLVSKHAANKRIYVFYWSCFDTKYIKQVTGGSKVLSNEEQRFSRQKYWRGVMHAVIEEERSKAQEGREDA